MDTPLTREHYGRIATLCLGPAEPPSWWQPAHDSLDKALKMPSIDNRAVATAADLLHRITDEREFKHRDRISDVTVFLTREEKVGHDSSVFLCIKIARNVDLMVEHSIVLVNWDSTITVYQHDDIISTYTVTHALQHLAKKCS